MLNKIIKFSLDNKLFILVCAIILMVAGSITTKNMDVDVFPDLTAPTVVVLTDAHGMAAEEVEKLVTFPIETAINGATGVRRVRSTSAQGYSFVWAEFDWGMDVFKARQIVSEKLISVNSQMPLGVGQPTLAPQSSVMGEIFFLGLQADSTNLRDLHTIAEWNIKPLLLATTGVSQVTVIGGENKEYQVLADPERMKFLGVSMKELADACKNVSQNSNGGILRQYGNEYVIRGIARTNNVDELGNIFVKTASGKAIRLHQVADVSIGNGVKTGTASINAKPAVIISILKQPKANTSELTQRIENNLQNLQKTLPKDVSINTNIFKQADFINTSITNVQRALIEGSVFVIIILILFLGSFRTTLISLIAIPLSLLGAVLVLKWLNLNINTMSLGGMAIAIGVLVDDAIIDVENVYKRLRQNRLLPPEKRRSAQDVVFNASKEIRASIINATLIIITAFIPLFFLSGMEGRMLKPLGISFIVSLFVSMIVAMTLTPLLCKLLLTNDNYLSRNQKDKWIIRKLSELYTHTLTWSLQHKKAILGALIGLFILSSVLFFQMGHSFLPEFNEGSLTLAVVTKPGTSLEESDHLGTIVEKELLSISEIQSTARRTGRGELDEHSQSSNGAEIDVNFKLKERSREAFLKDVRTKLANIPGVVASVGQPLGHRIDHILSGTRANIAVKLFGNNLNTMFRFGNDIKAAITGIEGLVDVSVEQQTETPQIQIKANRDMMNAYNVSMSTFNEFVTTAFNGEKMADIYEGQRNFNLVLKLNKNYTESIDDLKKSLLDTEDGKKVPLEQIAEVVSVAGPGSISRENVQRKLVISANVAGRDLRSVVNDIKKNINEKVKLPEGYRVEYGGQFESEARASQTLMLTSIGAILLIFLLLYQEFKNTKLAGIVLLNLPLALIGGVFAIFITSNILSIPAIIGFITLFGIATRNGILLISHYQQLQQEGHNLQDTVIKGSMDRLAPILMTALTAALALIPLALRGNLSGNEIQSPMAKVILGGLMTSTLLNMYVIPIVYTLYKKKQE